MIMGTSAHGSQYGLRWRNQTRQKHEERELLPASWGLINSWATDAKGAKRYC